MNAYPHIRKRCELISQDGQPLERKHTAVGALRRVQDPVKVCEHDSMETDRARADDHALMRMAHD